MGEVVGEAGSVVDVPGYVIGERLGAGGFGEVFAARHRTIGREVAIKLLHAKYSSHPEAVARFIAEARAVNKVSHPGIVEISDFGLLPDGRQYCVMERLHGSTLREVLRDRIRLPLAEALTILRGMAEAVDAAHAAGIAHRDLKPDNVFVLADGSVKLIDFGLAKLTGDNTEITKTGSIFGTPLYMSPEQCRGVATGTRTDQYSFGAVAYHILVGEPPFQGDALSLAIQHLNDEPPRPSSRNPALDERVDRVLLALLLKDPARRPNTLVAAVQSLEGVAPLPRRIRSARRIPWVAIGVVLVALAVAIIAFVRVPEAIQAPSVNACMAGTWKLAGVWDVPTRAAVQGRFASVAAPDVAATWRYLAADLDRYATDFARRWDDACESPDRHSDALLYAQRTNCLENALLDLRGVTESLAQTDVRQFSGSWDGLFAHAALTDCENPEVLRSMPPIPAPHNRAKISELLKTMYRARADVRAAIRTGLANEDGANTLEAVSTQLLALGAAGAADAAVWRAWFYQEVTVHTTNGENYDKKLQSTRAAIDEAIRISQATRNDVALSQSYALAASLALGMARRDWPRITDMLDRADAARQRSGGGASWISIATLRAQVLSGKGDVDGALALLSNARRTDEGEAGELRGLVTDNELVLLAMIGRHDEATRLARAALDAKLRAWGPEHDEVVRARFALAAVLSRAGAYDKALLQAGAGIAVLDVIGTSADNFRDACVGLAGYAFDSNASSETDRGLDCFAKQLPANRKSEALALVSFRSSRDGFVGLERHVLSQAETTPDVEDSRAFIAYRTGDWSEAGRSASSRLAMGDNDEANALWINAAVQARLGQRALAQKGLDLVKHLASEVNQRERPIYIMTSAWVLLQMQRWQEAKTVLEAEWSSLSWPYFDVNTALFAGTLGHVRLHENDPGGAIEPLYTALSFTLQHAAGFSPEQPTIQFDLARATWSINSNPALARYFATQAHAGYVRLGPASSRAADEVARWLVTHPLPAKDH